MAATLTKISVDQARASAQRREIADGACPGLYLAIHPTGAKSWTLRFRSPIERDEQGQRKAKKLTLGPLAQGVSAGEPKVGHPLSLTQARALAAAALEQVQRQIDPTHERRAERAKHREPIRIDTIDAAIIEFMVRYRGKKKQGLRESTRLLTASYLGLKPNPEKPTGWVKTGSGVLKRWSGRPLSSITKRDVIELVEAIDDNGQGVTANRTLTVLKTFFLWAVKRDMLSASPAAMVDAPASEKSRDRKLSDVELAALWKAADEDGYPFGRLIQLLILTGARRDELREAPGSEFDMENRVWVLPSERVKNGHEHRLPLTDDAIAILRDLKRIKGKGLLFTTTGDTPISGLSKAKKRIDAAMLVELRKSDRKATLPPWTLHDVRRTVATGMAESCNVPPHIIEAVLNHISGESRRGVAGIYNRSKYFDQMREALEAWARHVESIVR